MNDKNENGLEAAKLSSAAVSLGEEKSSDKSELTQQIISEPSTSSAPRSSNEGVLNLQKYYLSIIERYYSTANSLTTTNCTLAISYYNKALDNYEKYKSYGLLSLNDVLNIAMIHYNMHILFEKSPVLEDSITAKLHFCKAVFYCETLNKKIVSSQMEFDFFHIRFAHFSHMLSAKIVAMLDSGQIKTAITQSDKKRPLEGSLYKFSHAQFVLNQIKNCDNQLEMTISCRNSQVLFEIKQWLKKEKTLGMLFSKPILFEELQNNLLIRDKRTILYLKEWEKNHRNIIMYLRIKDWKALVDSIFSFITLAQNILSSHQCDKLFDIYVYKTIRCISAEDKITLMKVIVDFKSQNNEGVQNKTECVKRVRFDQISYHPILPNSETTSETNNNNTKKDASINVNTRCIQKNGKSSAFFMPANKKLPPQNKAPKTNSEESQVRLS